MMLREFLWILPNDAAGFSIDLYNALEDAGLTDIDLDLKGHGLITARGRFAVDAPDFLSALLGELDGVAYVSGRATAAASVDGDVVRVAFATGTAGIGVATVQLEATLLPPPSDIAAR